MNNEIFDLIECIENYLELYVVKVEDADKNKEVEGFLQNIRNVLLKAIDDRNGEKILAIKMKIFFEGKKE